MARNECVSIYFLYILAETWPTSKELLTTRKLTDSRSNFSSEIDVAVLCVYVADEVMQMA